MPALAPRIDALAGGIHFIDEEGGDCFKFTEGLAAWCRERGAVLGFGTTVERLEADGARITGVHTDRGEFVADAYVLALGADSPLLMRPLGVRLPIIPVKGYSITVPKAPFPDAPTIPVLDELRKFGMMPLPAGCGCPGSPRSRATTRCPRRAARGPSSLASPACSRSCTSAWRLRAIWALLLPASGHPARAADPRPLPLCNLFYNVGQGHLGWTLAHGSAKVVAALFAAATPAST